MTYQELQGLIDKANQANKIGNYDEAATLANTVLSELDNPNPTPQGNGTVERLHLDALLIVTTTLMSRGQYDVALEQGLYIVSLSEKNNCDVQPKAYTLIGSIYHNMGNYNKSLEYHSYALNLLEDSPEKSLIADITRNMGLVYSRLGSYDKALECFSKALAVREMFGEKSEIAYIMGNIGNVYNQLGSFDKALEYMNNALMDYEELGEKAHAARITVNIGNVYYNLDMDEKALEYYSKALIGHQELGAKLEAAITIGNMGNLYMELGMYDKAHEYLFIALAAHKELKAKTGIVTTTGNIGKLYAKKEFEGYNPILAEEYFLKAITLSEEIGAKGRLFQNEENIAKLYETLDRKAEAYDHFVKYHILEKEVLSEEAQRLVEKMEDERREAEREKSLAVERALSKATNDILANILPSDITGRLLKGEKKIVNIHESVSILFVDIVGFTQLSSKLPAGELIELLDIVFTRFDTICKKHGLEKIKTIGDAYMAVCGAPVSYENHAERSALAALEMLEDFAIDRRFSVPINLGFRIGLHSGNVVAGIIGENKYSYDLWGDAVNTASRMESYGEEDKIHVSEEFRNSARDKFIFIERGELDIKGKGMMKTYFLERNQ